MQWINYLDNVTGFDRRAVDLLQAFSGHCLWGRTAPGRLLGLAGSIAETFVFIKVLVALAGERHAIHFGGCFLDDAACRLRLRDRKVAYLTDFYETARNPYFMPLLQGLPVGDGKGEHFTPRCNFIFLAEKSVHLEALPPEIYRRTLAVQFHRLERPLDTEMVAAIMQEKDAIREWAFAGFERLVAANGFEALSRHPQHIRPEKQINKIVPQNLSREETP